MDANPEKPKKTNKHLQRFFLGWQNRFAAELIFLIVLAFAVTFITLGFVILSKNSAGFTYKFDYTDHCSGLAICNLPVFDVPGGAKLPLHVRYQVDNFHQNHYQFKNSVPTEQLINGKTDKDSNSNCGKYLTNSEMNKTLSATGRPLDPAAVAIPCGVLAYTYFTDEFSMFDATTSEPIAISTTGIAWPTDKQFKFLNVDIDRQWIDVQSEQFINWMRISPYFNFVKSWGVAAESALGKKVRVQVANNWDAQRTKSRKSFVLTTSDFYGTPNTNLVVFFLVFGFSAAIFGVLLVVQWCVSKHDKFFSEDEASEASNELEPLPTT